MTDEHGKSWEYLKDDENGEEVKEEPTTTKRNEVALEAALLRSIVTPRRDMFFLAPRAYPGDRVNYRSREEIAALLEDGYLELEALSRDGEEWHHRVLRKREHYYFHVQGPIGVRSYVEDCFYSLDEVFLALDLHAYKWYPLTTVSSSTSGSPTFTPFHYPPPPLFKESIAS